MTHSDFITYAYIVAFGITALLFVKEVWRAKNLVKELKAYADE